MKKSVFTFLFSMLLFCLDVYAQSCTIGTSANPVEGQVCTYDSDGSWTCPANATITVDVQAWGGGGGGGLNGNGPESGGGGGGAYVRSAFTITCGAGGQNITVDVGDGGSVDNNGLQSSFGSLVIALGGAAGSSTNESGGAGGSGPSSTGQTPLTDVKRSGGIGGAAHTGAGNNHDGGAGGAAGGFLGDGDAGESGPDGNNGGVAQGGDGSLSGGGSGGNGADADDNPSSQAGSIPGGGGGGRGVNQNNGAGTSAAGARGRVIVEVTSLSLLPVEMLSFESRFNGKEVQLMWQTASELNNDKFVIECSTDGKIFKAIGEVKGNGTSHERNDYIFTDKNPLSGINYYRLRQVDYDGTKSYSKMISVKINSVHNSRLLTNPVANELTIEMGTVSESGHRIVIMNALGLVVRTIKVEPETTLINLPVFDLAAGNYYVEIQGNQTSEIHKWVKL